jgi:type VI secretion system protein ImpL
LLAYLLALLVVVVAAALAFGIAILMHLQGVAYVIFVSLILLIGVTAAIVIIVMHHRGKKQESLDSEGASKEAKAELDLLLNDSNRRLRESQQGAKTLEFLPLIYILGDADTGKTTTIQQSGLEPELISGAVSSDSTRVPTQTLNLWYTRLAAFLEVGQNIRENNALLARLVHRTRATAYRSAFGAGAPPRAVIVCVSSDQLLQAGGSEALVASARGTGTQLREISRILGMQVPVYVIVTKLDRVPHFEQYVRNLSDDEARQVLGTSLARIDSSAGTYADQAARSLSGAIDSLVFKLSGFRVEMLDRENDPANVSGVYEFPREFGKLRKNLSQYLVELCKPSQLSANPYLRGFYFTGVRARIVERAGAVAAPTPVEAPIAKDAGATQFLNLAALRASSASQVAAPVVTSARVPQWTFLPRLLPEVVLGDKSALAPTRQSTPARLFRRILYGTLAFTCALFIFFVALSYFKNAALERRIREDAHALQSAGAASTSIPSLTDLRNLDDLRQVIVQLDDYHQNGRPLSYSFGLYQGENLRQSARQIYFDRFRPLFLNATQAGFVDHLRSLPDAPLATSDTTSYLDAYNPLKAYLITTNHPEKSQSVFLTPIFLKFWSGTRQVDADQQQLARKQIDFYGDELLRKPPYSINPDLVLVAHTQAYLSKFLANTRIYQSMLNDADKKNPRGIDFNKQYPDAVRYVSDSHVVRGAFTREGFSFMQDEALKHPEKYAQGETWVLGDQGAASLDVASLGRDLTAQYSSDYLKEWHQFLLSAHVAPCGGIREAPKELAALSGPASPILELLYVISHNTAVSDPAVKNVFQPAQAVVDPNAGDRLVGAGNNKDYVTALGTLGLNLDQAVAQNPTITTDPAAFAMVSPQLVAAKGAVQQVAQSFNIDKENHTETLISELMSAPISCIDRLAPTPGAAAGAGGAKVCEAINPLLSKYPFANSGSSQATLPEIDSVFAPETGVLWTTLNKELKPFLMQTGTQIVPAPASPAALNPRFIAYINRAAHVSNELYAPGQRNAAFTFTLRFIPGGGVTSATFDVDGQRIPNGATSQQFTWNGATAQRASLLAEGQEASFPGKWSVFQLVRTATRITRSASGYRLEYPINTATTIAGRTVGGSGSKIATFELSGPGADLLVDDAFRDLSCVRALAK